ncbi:histone H1, gonadal-like [Rhipicephalus sanguineus]|uniref:histone H1, gonadal-like n=1 Tax=Rhipicephalus sanguineus TaxID=34632 RepID=UPI0018954178|nr:histone H1, gonadal-like [Rhipicephalus sanguineus]
MPKKEAEANRGPPKAGRGKRQVAADDDAAGPSNEATAAKRSRGRPPKVVSVEPLAPKPIATTAARKSRKAVQATQPESENPSAGKAVATRAPRVRRAKRSRSSSASSNNDTASEAPKRRSTKRKAV